MRQMEEEVRQMERQRNELEHKIDKAKEKVKEKEYWRKRPRMDKTSVICQLLVVIGRFIAFSEGMTLARSNRELHDLIRKEYADGQELFYVGDLCLWRRVEHLNVLDMAKQSDSTFAFARYLFQQEIAPLPRELFNRLCPPKPTRCCPVYTLILRTHYVSRAESFGSAQWSWEVIFCFSRVSEEHVFLEANGGIHRGGIHSGRKPRAHYGLESFKISEGVERGVKRVMQIMFDRIVKHYECKFLRIGSESGSESSNESGSNLMMSLT
jgi:hypothetical protein